MKLLHTGDWHLGRIFNKQYLTEDQAHLLAQLEEYLAGSPPEVLIAAGDIYDRSVPPEEAVALLDRFLTRVVLELKIPTILLGGNHDGQERMNFGSRLLQSAGLHVVGSASATPLQIRLEDRHGPVYFYPLPYTTPVYARDLFHSSEIKTHHDAMAALVAQVQAIHPAGSRSVLIAHGFVAGGESSESERLLGVGGAGDIGPSLFAPFDYVALGHLHRPQPAGAEHIRYAGSLLKYSFSEANHRKGMTLVELDAEGFAGQQQLSFAPLRDVREVEGTFEQLLAAGRAAPSDDYLRCTLLDEGAILDPLPRLREVYPQVLEVRRRWALDLEGRTQPRSDFKQHSLTDLFADFFGQVTTEDLSAEQAAAFATVVASAPGAGEDCP